MTRFFDDLEAQLRRAAERELTGADPAHPTPPRPRPARWGWLSAGLRAAPVALAVALTVAVVVGALVLLHAGGRGTGPGPAGGGPHPAQTNPLAGVLTPQVRRELTYIKRADAGVLSRRDCRVPTQTATLPELHGRPSTQLLSLLAVLRQPAGARDRIGLSVVDGPSTAAYAGWARYARTVGGHAFYLVAARGEPRTLEPPARCFTAERVALDRLLRGVPAALRAPTQRLDAQILAFLRTSLRPTDVVCLVDRQGASTDSSCGFTATQIRDDEGGEETTEGPGAAGGERIIIVPDGVATVTIAWPAADGGPPRSSTGAVLDNLAAVRIPGYRSGGSQTPPTAESVTWRSASGRVIHRWQASAGGAAAMCRRDPIPCIAVMGASASGAGPGRAVAGSSYSASATAAATASRTVSASTAAATSSPTTVSAPSGTP
jgi:hypothetical protein